MLFTQVKFAFKVLLSIFIPFLVRYFFAITLCTLCLWDEFFGGKMNGCHKEFLREVREEMVTLIITLHICAELKRINYDLQV